VAYLVLILRSKDVSGTRRRYSVQILTRPACHFKCSLDEPVTARWLIGPYPSFALGHDLADAARHGIGVDHALECSPAIYLVGPCECPSGPERCLSGGGPEREVRHSR
jgi:hypothetical protein